jgi:hypothetical protein
LKATLQVIRFRMAAEEFGGTKKPSQFTGVAAHKPGCEIVGRLRQGAAEQTGQPADFSAKRVVRSVRGNRMNGRAWTDWATTSFGNPGCTTMRATSGPGDRSSGSSAVPCQVRRSTRASPALSGGDGISGACYGFRTR